MSRDLSIREYRETDEAALVGLVGELQATEAAFYDRMRPAAEIGPWYVADLKAQCAREEGTILIAERDGLVAGYATVYLGHSTEGDRDLVPFRYAHVGDLAVTAASRGTGIGKALLEECEARARAAGIGYLTVGAVAQNARALGLYQGFGFRAIGVELEKRLD